MINLICCLARTHANPAIENAVVVIPSEKGTPVAHGSAAGCFPGPGSHWPSSARACSQLDPDESGALSGSFHAQVRNATRHYIYKYIYVCVIQIQLSDRQN